MIEQHPIPQDITGFKFKLVGDMTLRQFGYLAVGLVFGWTFYATPWYPIVKLPLAFVSALCGIAFAFVPIEERPLDTWVRNFFKSIYQPTYLVWRKTASGQMDSPLLSADFAPRSFLNFSPNWFGTKATISTNTPPTNITAPATPTPTEPSPIASPVNEPMVVPQETPVTPTTKSPVLSIDELVKMREQKLAELNAEKDKLQQAQLEHKENVYQAKTVAAPQIIDVSQLEKARAEARKYQPVPSPALVDSEKQLQDLLHVNAGLASQIEQIKGQTQNMSEGEKSLLEQRLNSLNASREELSVKISEMQRTVEEIKKEPYHQTTSTISNDPSVTVLPKAFRGAPTLSLSDIPNVISGLVKDRSGQAIIGAIVLINDQTGNPVRALKTNKVGQFITSTPLENGTYFIDVERDGFSFDTLQVQLSNKVLPMLDITGKISATTKGTTYGSV